MALTEGFVEAHITLWESALASPYRPYRQKWPSRLFHHSPIENAVSILKDGNLRSRNDSQGRRKRDVAAPGVIDNRAHAHEYGRLYFRPRTPTQWHIEGIRKPGEGMYPGAHAPVLVMMIFDARRILTRDGVQFCDRNMQLSSAAIGNTEEYFNAIPFAKVFHEGDIAGDRSIIEHRCAEVLVTSPTPLDGTLQWIYCRTEAERLTLLHLLGENAVDWQARILVSDDLLVFERKYVFVDEVTLDQGGVVAKFNPRKDLAAVDLRVKVTSSEGKVELDFVNNTFAARPAYPKTHWHFGAKLSNGSYLVEIFLEGQMAFVAAMQVGRNIFL